MSRQIDIDLLLVKIAKLKTDVSNGINEKQLTVTQVLWILEQEYALQNSVTSMAVPDASNMCGLYITVLDSFRQRWASSANVVNCQEELSKIQRSSTKLKSSQLITTSLPKEA